MLELSPEDDEKQASSILKFHSKSARSNIPPKGQMILCVAFVMCRIIFPYRSRLKVALPLLDRTFERSAAAEVVDLLRYLGLLHFKIRVHAGCNVRAKHFLCALFIEPMKGAIGRP
jgi:hypothetical protein